MGLDVDSDAERLELRDAPRQHLVGVHEDDPLLAVVEAEDIALGRAPTGDVHLAPTGVRAARAVDADLHAVQWLVSAVRRPPGKFQQSVDGVLLGEGHFPIASAVTAEMSTTALIVRIGAVVVIVDMPAPNESFRNWPAVLRQ